MQRFAHIASKLFNAPLALTPDKAEMLVAALSQRLGLADVSVGGRRIVPMAFDQEDEGDARAVRRDDPGYAVVSGVAVIPIRGTLVQRLGSVRPVCGMTGYDGIRLAFMRALADTAVAGISFDIDSPGGEVAGCFDLVDTIFAARGRKPVHANLNECAFSAAYALATAADRITVPRTGGTGSVGVICMHTDMSKAMERAGVSVRLITFGDRKGDGSSYAPLSDPALARFQADVDAMGAIFVETVARNRNMSAAAVRKTQAGTYLGAAGVEVGFADEVASPDAAFRALLNATRKSAA